MYININFCDIRALNNKLCCYLKHVYHNEFPKTNYQQI